MKVKVSAITGIAGAPYGAATPIMNRREILLSDEIDSLCALKRGEIPSPVDAVTHKILYSILARW